MAVNHSREIQEASQLVLDNYVQAITNSVTRLHEATQTVDEFFQPIDQGIDHLQGFLTVNIYRLID